ncbi:hypothetical protein [Paenibacillus gansuensis]|uniref:Methyltransferase type 11 domain-containing protein n=1 Tax=Paenibacillus gansuensis TaxID=306542 RepID=A0ABW5PBE0_9BACL
MRVQLGCGFQKLEGFVGIDKFGIPGVDIVCDMDKGLPLEKDSVYQLVASHCLQWSVDPMKVMRDIYRVCKHKSIVYVIAPYSRTAKTSEIPGSAFPFNEYTPRLFTECWEPFRHRIKFPEGWFRKSEKRGETASSFVYSEGAEQPGMDFRLLNIELSCGDEYRCGLLDEDDRELLLEPQVSPSVEILYQLVAVKKPLQEEEWEELARSMKRDLSFDGFELDTPAAASPEVPAIHEPELAESALMETAPLLTETGTPGATKIRYRRKKVSPGRKNKKRRTTSARKRVPQAVTAGTRKTIVDETGKPAAVPKKPIVRKAASLRP